MNIKFNDCVFKFNKLMILMIYFCPGGMGRGIEIFFIIDKHTVNYIQTYLQFLTITLFAFSGHECLGEVFVRQRNFPKKESTGRDKMAEGEHCWDYPRLSLCARH